MQSRNLLFPLIKERRWLIFSVASFIKKNKKYEKILYKERKCGKLKKSGWINLSPINLSCENPLDETLKCFLRHYLVKSSNSIRLFRTNLIFTLQMCQHKYGCTNHSGIINCLVNCLISVGRYWWIICHILIIPFSSPPFLKRYIIISI